MELKFPKIELELWVLRERRLVELNGKQIYISPIELQIAFKLSLGTEKDIEDSLHLYRLFKEKIDEKLLMEFVLRLNVQDKFERYLK